MAQQPRQLTPHLSGRHRLGNELRSWRERQGLSQDALGRLAYVSGDLIGKVEKATRRPSPALIEKCDRILHADGALLTALAAIDAAVSAELDERLQLADLKSDLLDPGVDPLTGTGSLTDAARSWREMLALLAADIGMAGLTKAEPIVRGQLHAIARLGAAEARINRDLVAAEALWTEHLSWIHDNTRPLGDGNHWLTRARQLSAQAQTPALTGYILMRQSQQAIERGDHNAAIILARQAQRQPSLPPGTRALSAIREAQGLAHAGDDSASREKIRQAHRLTDQSTATPDDLNLTGHCTTGYIAAHEAYCRLILGEPERAAEHYEQALTTGPDSSALDEGLWRAHLAQAYSATGRHDRAGLQAMRALALAQATTSARAMRVLDTVAVTLRRTKTSEATEFLAAYRTAVHTACND